jgi:Ketosteroid isomerase-related protein
MHALRYLSESLPGKYSQAVLGIAPITGYTDIEMHRTTDPDCIIVEMKGHGTVVATGNSFERRYIDVFRTKNGRIQFIRDYWNPQESPTVKG